jgi:1-phosphofructokinase family hexose kinase
MFICVSANPAIDTRLTIDALVPGRVHRAGSAQSFPGGKATHVAMVLRTLGEAPEWIGPCGGATGAELTAGLSALGIQATPCFTQQRTRTNLEIVEDSGKVTEILEPGAAPSTSELGAFEDACKSRFAAGREDALVIFSGSLPQGAAPDLYVRLIASAQRFGCRTMLDTSGEPLRLALAAHPDFVKPNREEAVHLFNATMDSHAAQAPAIRKLFTLGARAAALSLGAEGLLFCPAQEAPILFAPAPSLQIRSSVGSGDSALAGFAVGIAAHFSPEDTLRLAAACGAANCLAESPGTARLSDIRRLQREIRVEAMAANP